MELKGKALNILELPDVLKMLSGESVSQSAKAAAESLLPSGDVYVIRAMLAETAAAKSMISMHGNPPFSSVKDPGAALKRAEAGGSLNIRELLDIAAVLRAARNVRAYGDGEDGARTAIDYLFKSLSANKYLEEKIFNSILNDDEIADAASSELQSIRRSIRVTNSRVRETLQKIVNSSHYASILQEPIITMRSDRYVVPVKAEQKGALPGLVHDVSSSGATIFIEPMQVVTLNNELRELSAKEEREIERILMELSAEAADHRDDILTDFDALIKLDLVFAKAKLAFIQRASEPEIKDAGGIILRNARHPLIPGNSVVPINARLGNDFDTLVITGPNTGGKTVTLKTIGLICLMAQCGLQIPADDGSELPVFEKILVDIGDEQSIQQSLSTFSSHMTNIVGILKEADDRSLILFDELGAGTDPVEGAALAIAIIEYTRGLGSKIVATTHYAELKVYASNTAGVQNASCEFDVETLRPTYRLLIGIPGKSNAFAISRRLGLPEIIIEKAAGELANEQMDFENMLLSLESERQAMERERIETRRLLRKAQEDAGIAEEYRRKFESEREKAAERARREAQSILSEARRASDEVFKELNELRKNRAKEEDWQRVNEARAGIRRTLNETEAGLIDENEQETTAGPPARPIRAGDRVRVLAMGTEADVISVGEGGSMQLQAGILKINVRPEEVVLVEDKKPTAVKKGVNTSGGELKNAPISTEIDIRGMNAEEAVMVMEQFLDNAFMGHVKNLTVIHGKGTGILRSAVHNALKMHRHVKNFRLGRFGEGETGVTVVELS